jgi:glycosyltransferase involved in cell wall biosynthesis
MARRMTRLYYVVQSEMLTGGVIEAQVIASLRAHNGVDGHPDTELVFLEPARVAFSRAARTTLAAYRRMWPSGRIRVVPFVGRLGAWAPGAFLLAHLARERVRSSSIAFHCRGAPATLSAGFARRALGKGRVVFDIRGAWAEETIHRLGFPWPERLSPLAAQSYASTLALERQAAAVADRVFAVSRGLKRYAIDVLGTPESRVSVVPSCVERLTFDDAARSEARRAWGVQDDAPVLLYSGRLGRERLPGLMFRLFRMIRQRRPDARLVVMTYRNQLGDILAEARSAGVPPDAVRCASAHRDAVVRQLCGADLGLLFLEPAARHEHCLPIKTAEYLGAGLGLVVNDTFEVPALVRRHRLGWVIGGDDSDAALAAAASRIVDELDADRIGLRQRCLLACSKLFLWDRYLALIRTAYGPGSGDASLRGPIEAD